MRMTIYISLLVWLGAWLASCETDTGISIPEPRLKVTEANIIFEAQRSEGHIKVEAPGVVTAESDQSWCVVSVADKVIRLSVSANEKMKGRAAVITIRSESESTTVTAVQTGMVLWIKGLEENMTVPPEGASYKFALAASSPVSVTSKPDWATYRIENDSLYLDFQKGGIRKGAIVFTSGTQKITLNILQLSYSSFLGKWEMKYVNPDNSATETATVWLTEKEKNISFTLDSLVISNKYMAKININYQPKTYNILLSGVQSVAIIDKDHVYLCLLSANNKSYAYVRSVQILGVFSVSDDNVVTYTFVDNKTWQGNVANGFGFCIFTGPLSAKTYTGRSYRNFSKIVMTKK